MPSLTEIFADPRLNGVYRIHGELPHRQDLLRLDGRELSDRKALLAAIGRVLEFPDYYGANWDALEECLFDLSWWDGPVYLLIEQADRIPEMVRNVLADIWTEAAMAWAEADRGCALFLQAAEGLPPHTP